MSMKRIAVIGLGTLGGALCKNISEMESIDELVIVDYDKVEGKNVHNSVYNASHIGETKVDALSEIIGDEVHVIPKNMKYEEGKTPLPKCDLIIDCRDVVCNRGKEIDVRLYISGKILIIDCRKNFKTQYNYQGSYRNKLKRSELNKAGFFAAHIICSKQIKEMLSNQMVQRIDLDLIPSVISKAVKKSLDNRIDIIYDDADRLHCLEENIKPIMNLVKTKDVDVYIGSRDTKDLCCIDNRPIDVIPEVAKTKYAVIPHNSLKSSTDLIRTLTDIVQKQHNLVNFIVTVREINGESFVELLEETGAA